MLQRLDGELGRLMFTLQGVMRTEFGEGLDLQAAADEASIEVLAPDRALMLTRPDGQILARWGEADRCRPGGRRSMPTCSTRQTSAACACACDRERVQYQRPSVRRRRHGAAAGARAGERGPAPDAWPGHPGGAGRRRRRGLAGRTADAAAARTKWPRKRWRSPSATPTNRLRAPHAHDELGRLATAFNGLLDRLVRALQAQRQFMADASHELRTPVSVVRTTAQVTLAREAAVVRGPPRDDGDRRRAGGSAHPSG